MQGFLMSDWACADYCFDGNLIFSAKFPAYQSQQHVYMSIINNINLLKEI